MAVISIDDIYILNETGAQVDKVAGLFTKDEGTTSGEKAFAQLNIGTAGSNRNLLDNPWFTVRQRGNGPFGAGIGYTVDRWTKFYNGIVTGTDNGVSITPNTTSGWIEFAQYLPADLGAALEGETLTLSVLLQDGTLYSKSGVCAAKPSSGTTNFITISMPNSMGFVAGRRNDGALRVEFTYSQAYSQDPLNVRAVKLELGSVSTLANDAPPDYWQELDKCLYYFERITNNGSSPITIGAGFADGANALYAPVRIHRKRAGISTISTSGAIYAGQRSSNISVSSVSQYNSTPDGIITLLANAPSSFTSNEYYRLALGAGAHIDFSAEP